MISEFTKFLYKTNALALAIGVIIGAATGKVVSSVVDDLIMPIVGFVLPKGDWREAQIVLSTSHDEAGKITVNALKYGHLIGSFVDFVIISFVVYMITKALLPKEEAGPATKTCNECKETIPADARRCKACTAVLVS